MRPVRGRPESRWRRRCAAHRAGRRVVRTARLPRRGCGCWRPANGRSCNPSGEEELIAGMLVGEAWPFMTARSSSGGVEYTVIKATYDCPGSEVTLRLEHPRNATMTSTRPDSSPSRSRAGRRRGF